MQATSSTDTSVGTAHLLRQIADLSQETKTRQLEWNTLIVTTSDDHEKERLIAALVLLEDTRQILVNAFSGLDIHPELPFDRLSEIADERFDQYVCTIGWSASHIRQQHQLAGVRAEQAQAALIRAAGLRIEMARSGLSAAIQSLTSTAL